MKNKPSLNRRLLLYITGSAALLTLMFVFFVIRYFFWGIDISVGIDMERQAKHYQSRYENDPHTPLPSGLGLWSFHHLDEIPPPLLELFPAEDLKHAELMRFGQEPQGDEEPNHPFRKLTDYCGQELCEAMFFYPYQMRDGSWLYLLKTVSLSDINAEQHARFERLLYFMIPPVLFSLGTMLAMAVLLIRKIGHPIKSLSQWADSLTLDNLIAAPEFKLRELDGLAQHLEASVRRIGRALHNEQIFLQNASHELRTPIAVMSANLALLNKLGVEGEEQAHLLARLGDGVKSMQQLTHTLLWLSREEQAPLPEDTLLLIPLLQQIIEDNRYILHNKPVKVTISGESDTLKAPVTLVTIALTNLVRNAFQYTHDGEVSIKVAHYAVEIENKCNLQLNNQQQDYGFGLGLSLVAHIADKYHWQFESSPVSGGRLTQMCFSPGAPNKKNGDV